MKTLAFLLVGVLFSTSSELVQAQAVNSQDRDIGNVAVAGSASNNGSGAFTINGSGADIWGTADEFHYVYFSLDGDMELTARVTGVQFTDAAQGRFTQSSDYFSVWGSGEDIYGTSDEFGTHHWYRVAATNSAGISPYSNIAEATTPTSMAV